MFTLQHININDSSFHTQIKHI